MANYQKIIEHRPEMADFFGNRRLISFRGDVLSYRANFSCDSFSVDAAGFRHSTFRGKTFSVTDCLESERYGIVLGPSTLFGFGVAGNENLMASLLAERFGFPFANAAMPGGNSRNLQSLLVGLMVGAPRPPAIVILSNGGDLANFCQFSLADPVFGSPNHSQLKALQEATAAADAEQNFQRLLPFTSLWTGTTATTCRLRGVPLVMIHQSTFFDKTKPTPIEVDCELGKPLPRQQRQFDNHRKFDERFFKQRKALADRLGVPLAGLGLTDRLGFLDEFHCDRDGTRLLSEVVGNEAEHLLSTAKPAAKKEKAET